MFGELGVGGHCIVYIPLLCSLTERVAIVDVGQLFQHLSDFLGEIEISCREADSNLHEYEIRSAMLLLHQHCPGAYRRDTSDHPEDGRGSRLNTRQRTREIQCQLEPLKGNLKRV